MERTVSAFCESRLPVGSSAKQDSRTRDQGAGDGDALLLAAGELVGAVIEAAFDLQQASEFVEQGLVEGLAGGGDLVGELDVRLCGDRREQIEALEDEADLGPAQAGALRVREARKVFALDQQGAGGRGGKAAEDIEERRFTRAGRANDGDEFARLDVEGDVAQGFDLEFAGTVDLAEMLGRDDGVGGGDRGRKDCGLAA